MSAFLKISIAIMAVAAGICIAEAGFENEKIAAPVAAMPGRMAQSLNLQPLPPGGEKSKAKSEKLNPSWGSTTTSKSVKRNKSKTIRNIETR